MSEKIFTADEFAALPINHLELHKFTLTVDGKVAVRVVGGSGGVGDMLASVYDPAAGARQVAFADELFSGAYGDLTGTPTLGTMAAENTTSYYTNTQVDTLLSGKEDSFTKNTAFNKNFGTSAGTVLEGNTDVGIVGTKSVDELNIGNGKILSYNSTSGNLEYITLGGGGDMLASVYDPAAGARQVAFADELFSGAYGDLTGTPTLGTMAAENTTSYYTNTQVDTLLAGYSLTSHNHTGVYEPVFTKNTAFNKDFGTSAGTVLEGNTNVGIVGTKSVDEVAIGDGKMLSYNSTSGNLEYIALGTMAAENTTSYYTSAQVDTLLSGKSDTSHTHTTSNITDLASYTGLDVRYYTETEVDSLFTGYVALTGNQTIAGVKTFSSFPVTPSSAPTTDYQVANKKYVDDNAGGGGAILTAEGDITAGKPVIYIDEEEAYNISNATFNNFFSVAGSETGLRSLAIKPDGTKIYLVGADTAQAVYEFTLSTAFDITTASLTDTFSVSSQETGPRGIALNADGTSMYIVGSTNDTVYQYTLSTAWDLTTASYASKSVSVGTQSTVPTSVRFNTDGTIMYIADSSGNLYQYTLSTGFDVSTASYASKTYNASAQGTGVNEIEIKPDGTKFYLINSANDTVYQYSMSTAWDISTASYDSISKLITDTSPQGMVFGNNGQKLYISGDTSNYIREWDTGTYVAAGYYNDSDSSNTNRIKFVGFAKTSALSGNTFILDPSGVNSSQSSLIKGLEYYLQDVAPASGSYDLSSVSYDSKNYDIGSSLNVQGIWISENGNYLYSVESTADVIRQFSLSTPFDVSTATYVNQFYIGGVATYGSGITIGDNGNKLYVICSGTDKVHQYSFGTAYDITTLSYDSKTSPIVSNTQTGVTLGNNGTRMYVSAYSGSGGYIYQYNLSTAYDVSTATLFNTWFQSPFSTYTILDLFIKDDGTQIFFSVSAGLVYSVDLLIPFNIPTSGTSGSVDISTQVSEVAGMCFGNNGEKLYAINNSASADNTVYQYSSGIYIPEVIPGDIGINPGTNSVKVGKAISATEIEIYTGGRTPSGSSSAVRAYRATTNQTLSSGTTTKIELNAETYDIKGEFDSDTNYRFTATDSGRYMVTGSVDFDTAASGRFYVYIYVNGSAVNEIHAKSTGGTGNITVTGSDILNLSAGDYVELYARSVDNADSAAAVTVGNPAQTFMSIAQIQ